MSMEWHNPGHLKPKDKQFVWYVLAGKVRHGIYREECGLWGDCEERCYHGSTEVESWTPQIIPEMPRPEEIL